METTSKGEAQKLRYRVSHYILIDSVLYKQGYSLLLLRCLDYEKVDYVLREVHQGIYGNHSTGRSLSHKILRQGYY